jgi:hypothetical protein
MSHTYKPTPAYVKGRKIHPFSTKFPPIVSLRKLILDPKK